MLDGLHESEAHFVDVNGFRTRYFEDGLKSQWCCPKEEAGHYAFETGQLRSTVPFGASASDRAKGKCGGLRRERPVGYRPSKVHGPKRLENAWAHSWKS